MVPLTRLESFFETTICCLGAAALICSFILFVAFTITCATMSIHLFIYLLKWW